MLIRFSAVAYLCSALLLVTTQTSAQVVGNCQPTLQYLQGQIPTTGYSQLDNLRLQILATNMQEVVSKIRSQGLTLERAADLARQQADADAAALPQLESSIRGAIQSGFADGEMVNLRTRNYTAVSLGDSVLGAAVRAYIAADWGALANRETAKQLQCFGFGVSGSNGSPQELRSVGPEPMPDLNDPSLGPGTFPMRTRDENRKDHSPSGPSLEDTVTFLRQRLTNLESKVQIKQYGTSNGQPLRYTEAPYVDKLTAVSAEKKCEIVLQDGAFERTIPLAKVVAVRLSKCALINQYNEIYCSSPAYTLQLDAGKGNHVVRWKFPQGTTAKADAEIYITDEALAERIAKAFVHAVEICGGGPTGKPPAVVKAVPTRDPSKKEPF